jgi:hypothetical protein
MDADERGYLKQFGALGVQLLPIGLLAVKVLGKQSIHLAKCLCPIPGPLLILLAKSKMSQI